MVNSFPVMPPALADWTVELARARDTSLALAIAVFDRMGAARYLNQGMSELLGGATPDRPRHAYLANPDFARLLECGDEGLIFSGWLTVSDGHLVTRTLQASVYRKADALLVMGEFDVFELERLGRELARGNQQIQNLQRELIRKNAHLSRALEELRETQTMLIHAEKMSALGQLVAGFAHEINNPIAFIAANLDSLGEGVAALSTAYQALETLAARSVTAEALTALRARHDLDFLLDDFPALLAATVDGVGRVRRIVADLQTFSRLQEAERKTVDLGENLRSTLALAASDLRARQVDVQLNLDALPPVECYPAELNQVFMNLIVNALQAMPGGGRLCISGQRQTNGQIVLCFRDSGCGIPQAVIGRIFDPFFTTKPVGQGTGLGLSVSYNIIKRHGGQITVESVEGQGTAFTLILPERLP